MAQLNLHHGKGLANGVGASSEVWEFKANEALTAGDWVALDTSQSDAARAEQVIQANTSTDGLIGVALETVASGATVRVCVGGYVENAKAQGTILINKPMTVSGSTDGAAALWNGSSTTRVVAISLEAASGNTVDCFVLKVL